MSLVLLESATPTWIAGLVALIALMAALAFVMNIGGSRPHS